MKTHQSKIEKLIAELCPNGVEFKELNELGNFYSGLTGKSKNDFTNGNEKFITYMNVFSNIAVNTDAKDFVKISVSEKQNKIQYGDVLFTGSSENADECGMSSVLTKELDVPLYLNSFCFGFRFNNIDLFSPEFLKYLFRDNQMRKQIAKTANGVTRFNVSRKLFAKIKIPIPPLTIQKEIVRILDKFTELTNELTNELTARKKQYSYYRDQLLTFEEDEVEWKELGDKDYFDVSSGGTPSKSNPEYWNGGEVPWLKSESCNNEPVYKANNFITAIGLQKSSAKLLDKETTLIALVGATIFKTAFLEFKATTNQNIASIKSKKLIMVSDKFIFYYITNLYGKLKSEMHNYGMLNLTTLRQFKIPIPSSSEQARIVSILDKFDTLTHSISEGLPCEIALRQKQYEYYREKLLNFLKPNE